jgi:Zn-dependent protease with chaperone function
MPLGRYFFFSGGMLLALLFLADWYMPQLAATPARADVDRTIIRLHSLQKWPERIVFDTSLPTIVPPPMIADMPPVKLDSVARSPREAFAMATPLQAATPARTPKPAPKRRARTARTNGHVTSFEAVELRQSFPAGW